MITDKNFTALVEKAGGFEITLGYRDDVDHFIGGAGSTVWYLIEKKQKLVECYMATLENSVWKDEYFTRKGKTVTKKAAPSGKTLALITDRAYFGLDYIISSNRNGVPIDIRGNNCLRYNYNFGAIRYDVSDEYGVTVAFCDIDNAETGYSLRDLCTGSRVSPPTF